MGVAERERTDLQRDEAVNTMDAVNMEAFRF